MKRRRLNAFLIDSVLAFLAICLFYFVAMGLPLAAMGDYDFVQRVAYTQATPIAYSLFFFAHFVTSVSIKASIGQRLKKLWLVGSEGQRPKVTAFLGRSIFATLIFPTLVLLPGPAVGFYLGAGSGGLSLALLSIGTALCALAALWTNNQNRNLSERTFGLQLVEKQSDIEP
jgi:uncharacterized oligopeptide transporter (OPT) family protein